MTMIQTNRAQRRALDRENAKQSAVLVKMDHWQDMPRLPQGLIEVWRSREYLVQVYAEQPGIVRASINVTALDSKHGRWQDGIPWDDIQCIKREIGRGNKDAVEVYPADRDVVNVANMRHIWIFDEPLPYAWRRGKA
jgi:hypothetical protein